MVRIGFLGVAGPRCQRYAGYLRRAGAEVVGVFDPDPDRAARWGHANGVRTYPTVEAVTGEVDGLLVFAGTDHRKMIFAVAACARVAILCESPVGSSMQDSAAIVDACERARIPLMMAYPARFDPPVLQLRDLVARGDLGRVRALSGLDQSVVSMHDRSSPAAAELAPGAMMDQVVNLADVYSWILGSEPEEVYAVGNRIVGSDVAATVTSALVVVSYQGGAFGSIDCGRNRPPNYPASRRFALSAVGDGGTVDVESIRQRLVHFGGPQMYSWHEWGLDPNQPMIQEFLDCIVERRAPAVSGRDGLRASQVALAAHESLRTRAPVRLNPVPTGQPISGPT